MSKALSIPLDPAISAPLHFQLTRELKRSLLAGQLSPGDSLPSVRRLSEITSVSQATVRQAISELAGQGWLVLRRGKTARVAEQNTIHSEIESTMQPNESLNRKLRLEYDSNEDLPGEAQLSTLAQQTARLFDDTAFFARYDEPVELDFRAGGSVSGLLSGSKWTEAIKRWTKACANLPEDCPDPAGNHELRKHIANWLRQQRGIECTWEDIVVVSGAQQARHLIARLLVRRDTCLAAEDPGSIFSRLMFQAYGARIVPVPLDESGLLVSELQNAKDVSLLYVTPSAQFPTGAVLSQARRRQIAAWAEESQSFIIEDDNNCEFTYESRINPAIRSYDGNDRTIYIGTLSQLLAPAWRVGFMLIPKVLQEPLLRLKWLADRSTSPIAQQLVLELFASGYIKRHAKKALRAADNNRAALLRALEIWPSELAKYTPVKGGLCQTIWLPAQMDDSQVFDRCFEAGVGVLPLSPHFLTNPSPPGLILNFGSLNPEQIAQGVIRIRKVLIDLYGI
jgi:GntR family transcriptional regulator/MocR family aminotransferase